LRIKTMGKNIKIDLKKLDKECGCPRNCDCTGDCKKFNADAEKATDQENAKIKTKSRYSK